MNIGFLFRFDECRLLFLKKMGVPKSLKKSPWKHIPLLFNWRHPARHLSQLLNRYRKPNNYTAKSSNRPSENQFYPTLSYVPGALGSHCCTESKTFVFLFAFQRRPVPVSSDLCSQDLTDCMFPDLVFCTLPVEQILPSILTMSWSRGMGHLVRAQNIHTIGNLSALKEEQVTRDHVILGQYSKKHRVSSKMSCLF